MVEMESIRGYIFSTLPRAHGDASFVRQGLQCLKLLTICQS